MKLPLFLPLYSALITSATTTTRPASYDYIVVGAGAAGIVVADRLSQAGKNTLLIERGGPSTKETGGKREVPPWAASTGLTRFDIPGLYQSMFTADDQWWFCKDMAFFGGCLLGGGTALNGLMYFPSPDSEFSASQGWPAEWRNPTPAIQKMLNRLPVTDRPSSDNAFYLDQVYTVLKTHFSKKGYAEIQVAQDRNRKDAVFGHPTYNFHNGIRSGPTHTYLQSASSRHNFKLLLYTYAQSVIRDGAKVTGVQTNNTVDLPNGIAKLAPEGRVILSSGVFGTARLLFTSGIGPSDMIAQVAASSLGSHLPPSSSYIDLPVGYHTSDGPAVTFGFSHPSVDSYDGWANVYSNPRPADAAQYVANRTGVYAFSSPRFFWWKALSGPDGKTRYMQGGGLPGGTDHQFGISFGLSQGLTSRGRIGIDSNLNGITLIDPWFQDPVDKVVFIQGIKDAIANLTTNVPGVVQLLPDPSITVEQYVDGYNKTYLCSNHWIGSTRLATNSSLGVVDVNCKVFHTNNLFVVDAGIIPGQPLSNPTAAIITTAEMGVARILALPGGP